MIQESAGNDLLRSSPLPHIYCEVVALCCCFWDFAKSSALLTYLTIECGGKAFLGNVVVPEAIASYHLRVALGNMPVSYGMLCRSRSDQMVMSKKDLTSLLCLGLLTFQRKRFVDWNLGLSILLCVCCLSQFQVCQVSYAESSTSTLEGKKEIHASHE